MFALIIRRLLWMIPTLLIISLVSFTIIELPPGDYLTSYIAALAETGETVHEDEVAALRARYNLDAPFHERYLKWLNGLSPVGFEIFNDGPVDGRSRGADGAHGRWTSPWRGHATCADQALRLDGSRKLVRQFAADLPEGRPTVFFAVRVAKTGTAASYSARCAFADGSISIGLADDRFEIRLLGDTDRKLWGKLTPGQPTLLVGKLEFNVGENRERLTMWVDPTGVEAGPHAASLLLDADVESIAPQVCLQTVTPDGPQTDLAVTFDDVRIATTWQAVTDDRPTAGADGLIVAERFSYYYNRLGGWPKAKGVDLGMSMEWRQPVGKLIGERFLLTVAISIATLLFTWAIAIPIGVISAVKQHSVFDYFFTFVGFIGLATPSFLLALIFMYVSQEAFGVSAGGLFSPEYQNAAWSWGKFVDLVAHLWIPMIVIGLAGTAGLIRIMRGNLLDELRKQYVVTARAKGVRRITMLIKYPVRIAINPIVSTIGWLLPAIVSGSVIVAVVLGLPTTGPLLLRALMNQDMYLAGSIVMLLSTLTVIGTLISDLLLLWLDPRIRYGRKEA